MNLFNFYNTEKYYRRKTNQVNVGNIPMGSNYPVRIQSMANTLTGNIQASIEQCIRIIKAGADYVRFTVPSITDAEAFSIIKNELLKKGYSTPLVADVHFNADIAIKVANYADKVRVNPGNFNDLEKFKILIGECRNKHAAIRIGINHGSLSPKIIEKFGDTPVGMAESAMEYLRICKKENFNDVVVSMKASNVRIMIYATRIIAAMMMKEEMKYPLHLGVTEAGEGEDGRIKSSVGIGTLLSEGLGDTIRVSLTEDPENEIPVAKKLVKYASKNNSELELQMDAGRSKLNFEKRISRMAGNIGGKNIPVVLGYDKMSDDIKFIKASSEEINHNLISLLKKDNKTVLIYKCKTDDIPFELKKLRFILDKESCDVPVIFDLYLNEKEDEDFIVKASIYLGSAFVDGFGDGVLLRNDHINPDKINSIALGILQACRSRMSKTEYISCPSCGRTNFNLMETLARIKLATSHLKNLKIGVMGCIVNGPGEMADADYGYVGAGRGKITLYKAKEVIKRNISEENAVDELVKLIKENNDWLEKP